MLMRRILLLLPALLAMLVRADAQELLERSHHPNGRLQCTRYSDGSSTYFVEYHPNGHVAAMGAYRDGRRHGIWKSFDERGVMRARAEFDRGQRCGTWEFRDGANTLQGTLGFAHGSLARASRGDGGGLPGAGPAH